ncbi:MAG: hypothetical protein AB7G07_16270 [Bauldia sp.]
MEYKTVDELERVGTRHENGPSALSRVERLERWAELLERHPDRLLGSLDGTEYQAVSIRVAMRQDNSPISVAFEDPVLRTTGLNRDTYGEAKRFFSLSDRELHSIVCGCHYGARMPAIWSARSIRKILSGRWEAIFLWPPVWPFLV